MAGQLDDIQELPQNPDLSPTLYDFFNAFFDLSTTRQNGMGIGVISWLNVRQYAEFQGYDPFAVYFLHKMVRALDPIYVEHLVNESKRNQKR